MTYRNLVAVVGMVLFMGACAQVAKIGGDPFETVNPTDLPRADGQEYVSICYNADTTTRQAVEALAKETCKEALGGIKFYRHDMIFNDCPVVTKARATFLCLMSKK